MQNISVSHCINANFGKSVTSSAGLEINMWKQQVVTN